MYKIELVTYKDVTDFVNIVSNIDGTVHLVNNDGFCVNGKSLIGALASMEWDNLYVKSDTDIYTKIQKFVCLES